MSPLARFFSQSKPAIAAYILLYLIFWFWASGALAYLFMGLNWKVSTPFSIYILLKISKTLTPLNAFIVYAAFAAPVIPILGVLISPRYRMRELYGSAREATKPEIREYGLLGGTGMILGKKYGSFLQAFIEHVLVYAPTGGGKGAAIVIPTCLTWEDSLIVADMKKETFFATSNYRIACGHKVFLFEPDKINTHCFNVFDLVDPKAKDRIAMLQKIANIICPPPTGNSDPMWAAEGRSLFIAAALYLMDSVGNINMAMVKDFIKGKSIDDLNTIIEFEADMIDPICLFNLRNYVEMGDKQRGGVKSQINSQLEVYDNPIVAKATSSSDFDIRNFKKEKITLYLGCSPSSLITMAPIFNLLFQFFIAVNTERIREKNKEPYETLLLLDEFSNLGRMDILKKGISYFRGYGIRTMVIIQGTAQLTTLYTESGLEEFIQNFRFRLTFTPNSQKEADKISAELGTETVTNISDSRSGLSGIEVSKRSESLSKAARALLLPQEVKLLDAKKSILLCQGLRPIFAEKTYYYKDPFFKGKFWNCEAPETTVNRMYPEIPDIFSADHQHTWLDTPKTIVKNSVGPVITDTNESVHFGIAAPDSITPIAEFDFSVDTQKDFKEVNDVDDEVEAILNMSSGGLSGFKFDDEVSDMSADDELIQRTASEYVKQYVEIDLYDKSVFVESNFDQNNDAILSSNNNNDINGISEVPVDNENGVLSTDDNSYNVDEGVENDSPDDEFKEMFEAFSMSELMNDAALKTFEKNN